MPKSTQDLLKDAQDAATKLHSLCGVRAELTEKLEANRIEIEKAEAATKSALGAYHERVPSATDWLLSKAPKPANSTTAPPSASLFSPAEPEDSRPTR